MTDYGRQSLEMHRKHRGKLEIASKVPLASRDDLSVAYTPGVATPCDAIAENPDLSHTLTIRGNTVGVISDGTAVLGLGNIGPAAAMPVMEGKAILFKQFADVDAIPLVVDVATPEALIAFVRAVAPTFGGINLEDIAAPRCFEVEAALQDIGIPVFHDDQHGTAVVLLAALMNAARVVGKMVFNMRVVISGAGAAGTAIAKLLRCVGHSVDYCVSVRDVLVCDSRGIISRDRDNLNRYKTELLAFSNLENRSGYLADALEGADAFIGVSKGGLLKPEMVQSMAEKPIILAMANPDPEIMPDDARTAGAAVIGTGRSDFPNQVNNLLAFPGIFRGALDARAPRITESMKMAAALALAETIESPTADRILPDPLDTSVAVNVATAVAAAASK